MIRDGSLHWTELVVGTLLDQHGNPEATLVSARNIDAEVESEAEAEETRRQQDRLIEQLPVGVFRARGYRSGVGRLDFVSPRCAELLRCPEGQLDIVMLMERIEPADFHSLYVAGMEAVATAGQLICDVRLARVEPTVWLRIRAGIDQGDGDEVVIDGTVADVTRDVADQVRLARDAEQAAARVEELAAIDRARAALLASLGHDLRTPLAVVAAAAGALRLDNLTAGQRDELLVNIELSTAALGAMLTDLLDLSRAEAGSLPVRLSRVAVIEALEEPLRHLGESVILQLDDDLPPVVADRGLLERVLDNLVRNAARYRTPGTPVRVAARVAGGRLLIRVIEHGPGLSAELQERIFLPFQRETDSGPDGVGLGLTIARAFSEAMGGRLTPSDTPGGGLTMTLDLPRG